jgi:quercetin dioxygenase-like cupin family protein
MSRFFVKPGECSNHAIFPGVEIHTCAGENLMLSVVDFAPGSVVDWHSHPHEQMGLLLTGELEFFVGDERQILQQGDMWRIPGGVRHKVIAGKSPAKALDVFHPVREDYL